MRFLKGCDQKSSDLRNDFRSCSDNSSSAAIGQRPERDHGQHQRHRGGLERSNRSRCHQSHYRYGHRRLR